MINSDREIYGQVRWTLVSESVPLKGASHSEPETSVEIYMSQYHEVVDAADEFIWGEIIENEYISLRTDSFADAEVIASIPLGTYLPFLGDAGDEYSLVSYCQPAFNIGIITLNIVYDK